MRIPASNDSHNDTYDYDEYDYSDGGYMPSDVEVALRQVMLPIVVSIGMFGIIMTLTVLTRKKTYTSTNCYLTALAATDLVFLLLVATHLLDRAIFAYGSEAENHFAVYVSMIAPIVDAMCMSSIWLTVTLTIERYIAVCRPLHTWLIFGVKGARATIVVVVIIAMLLRVPAYFEMKLMTHDVYEGNKTVSYNYMGPTSLSENKLYLTMYVIIVDVFIMAAIPFSLLLVFNMLIVAEVRRSNRYMKQRIRNESTMRRVLTAEQLQLTLILSGIVVVFFICQAPYVVYLAVAQLYRADLLSDRFSFVSREVTLLLLCLKSALNYALYCWFSEKFRHTFKRLFCMFRCLSRTPDRRHSGDLSPMVITRDTTC